MDVQKCSESYRETRLEEMQRRAAILAILVLCLGTSAVSAQSELPPINLIDIGQGAGLSGAAAGLGQGGYELADGTWQSFSGWYHTDVPEVHFEFLTPLSEDFGLIWGMGTGERAAKYIIDPSFRLGFIAQTKPTDNSVLSLTANTILFGQLMEQPCEADYGTIGGVQTVHCRLAASELAPADTLQYLAYAEPTRLRVSCNFRVSF